MDWLPLLEDLRSLSIRTFTKSTCFLPLICHLFYGYSPVGYGIFTQLVFQPDDRKPLNWLTACVLIFKERWIWRSLSISLFSLSSAISSTVRLLSSASPTFQRCVYYPGRWLEARFLKSGIACHSLFQIPLLQSTDFFVNPNNFLLITFRWNLNGCLLLANLPKPARRWEPDF